MKQVITNAYPMKLLKATQAKRKDKADKESEKERGDRKRKKDGWRKKELNEKQ